jgi:hypothetical protein
LQSRSVILDRQQAQFTISQRFWDVRQRSAGLLHRGEAKLGVAQSIWNATKVPALHPDGCKVEFAPPESLRNAVQAAAVLRGDDAHLAVTQGFRDVHEQAPTSHRRQAEVTVAQMRRYCHEPRPSQPDSR